MKTKKLILISLSEYGSILNLKMMIYIAGILLNNFDEKNHQKKPERTSQAFSMFKNCIINRKNLCGAKV